MTEHMFVTAPSYTPQQLPTTGKGGQDTVPAEPIAVLLLGGDAGTGRWGLRPDSINVAIFDPDSGRAGIIGIPRNLWGVPMPGKLADRFPDGFPGMINALHTWALGHRADVESALGATDHPGEALIAAVVSELTGIRLDGWVLVDMRGFIDVVDAVGPVDIWVERHVPLPGNIKDAKHPTPGHLDRGWHRLDGTDLLAYARSRSADSDYGRMRRQRCILASIAAQHTGPSLLLDWPSIARAAGSGVRTSLSGEQTLQIARYARAGVNAVETLSLSPPLMRSYGWDRSEVRAHVAELMTRISPTAGAPDAAPSPTSSVAPRAGEPQTDLPTTSIPRAVPPTSRIEPDPADLATLPPATTTPEVQAVVVTDEGCRTSR
jgi:LCP family protein required for cell wall assembly